ncbi:hypothetical protein ACH5RR_038795 [Cinchona calisaya]|uniref:Uncharacterized protein n=1 Tax=Cinchona calisaya TaxID=153742 RepID=A0ABD2XZN8_9GENT
MASHEESHRELEVEVDADQVEKPYDVHDDEHESDDPELNAPTGRFLGDAHRVVHRQQERETGQTSECRLKMGACFRYRMLDHKLKNCASPPLSPTTVGG